MAAVHGNLTPSHACGCAAQCFEGVQRGSLFNGIMIPAHTPPRVFSSASRSPSARWGPGRTPESAPTMPECYPPDLCSAFCALSRCSRADDTACNKNVRLLSFGRATVLPPAAGARLKLREEPCSEPNLPWPQFLLPSSRQAKKQLLHGSHNDIILSSIFENAKLHPLRLRASAVSRLAHLISPSRKTVKFLNGSFVPVITSQPVPAAASRGKMPLCTKVPWNFFTNCN